MRVAPGTLLAAAAAEAAVVTRKLSGSRTYQVQVPSGKGPWPVVMSFHGDGGTASEQAQHDNLRAIAGSVAIVAHGQGTGDWINSGALARRPPASAFGPPALRREWNATAPRENYPSWNGGGSSMRGVGKGAGVVAPDGETCVAKATTGYCYSSCLVGGSRSCDTCWWSDCLDDVGYVGEMLDDMESAFSVDTSKVFATGESNGALFVFQLMADPRMAHRIQAYASVAGLPHNGFLFPPANPAIRYMNVYGNSDNYVVAKANVAGRPDKSYSSKYGWYYSSIDNTTEYLASVHGYKASEKKSLTNQFSGNECLGWSKTGSTTAAADVAFCSWNGGHGWPYQGNTYEQWPGQLILDFFLSCGKVNPGPAPGPSPSGACSADKCSGGYSCDEWIAWDPSKYSCPELKKDYSCDCSGCQC